MKLVCFGREDAQKSSICWKEHGALFVFTLYKQGDKIANRGYVIAPDGSYEKAHKYNGKLGFLYTVCNTHGWMPYKAWLWEETRKTKGKFIMHVNESTGKPDVIDVSAGKAKELIREGSNLARLAALASSIDE